MGWQYKHSSVYGFDDNKIQPHLDEWSAAGWELVSTTLTPGASGPTHHFYWRAADHR